MEKEFVSYEIALELKELGFDEPCLGFYDGKGSTQLYFNNKRDASGDFIPFVKSERLTWFGTPTYSQAFRWFREKHNLRGFIGFRPNVKQFDCHVYDMSLSGKEYTEQRTMEEFNKDPKVGTYEEAEIECLKKLIEIVKEKKL